MFLNLLRGIHVPHRKDTADCPPQRIPIPATVSLPMSMHIGKPALPTVKPGDLVKVGQRIAEPDGPISAPIHAAVSGQVRSCGNLLLSNGQVISAVVIDSMGGRQRSLSEAARQSPIMPAFSPPSGTAAQWGWAAPGSPQEQSSRWTPLSWRPSWSTAPNANPTSPRTPAPCWMRLIWSGRGSSRCRPTSSPGKFSSVSRKTSPSASNAFRPSARGKRASRCWHCPSATPRAAKRYCCTPP